MQRLKPEKFRRGRKELLQGNAKTYSQGEFTAVGKDSYPVNF
jgi:hypothetical protein